MKGRTLLVLLALIMSGFFHFFNASRILHSTQEASRLEKALQAERNINTELKIEHDELTSDKYISTCVPQDMIKTTSNEQAGNLIFVREPVQQKGKTDYYCIIDLLTPKAEAMTNVQPD
jgi:hypothetical protein